MAVYCHDYLTFLNQFSVEAIGAREKLDEMEIGEILICVTRQADGITMAYALTRDGFVCVAKSGVDELPAWSVSPSEVFRVLTDVRNGGMNFEQAVTMLEQKIAEAVLLRTEAIAKQTAKAAEAAKLAEAAEAETDAPPIECVAAVPSPRGLTDRWMRRE